jgi:nucleoside 2-deoxyribosyltransferase
VRVQTILPGTVDPQVVAKRKIWINAARRHGVEVILPPLPPHVSEFDLRAALSGLRACQLVVADLSFERPSCYFELGLAQALGVPVVVLSVRSTLPHQHGPALGEYCYESLDDYEEVVDKTLSSTAKLA